MDDIKLTFHKASTETELAIPLAQSSVKAGFPSPAQDYMSEEIDLNRLLIHHIDPGRAVRRVFIQIGYNKLITSAAILLYFAIIFRRTLE